LKKKFFTTVISAFLIFLLGCGKTNSFKEINKRGKILVAVEDNCYPNVFKNPSSSEEEYIGIDIEIINEVAKKLNLTVEFIEEENKSAASIVGTKRADIAVSGIPIDESVKINYLCSIPYDSSCIFSVTKRGISYPTVGSLKGKKVASTNEFAETFRKIVSSTVDISNKDAKKAEEYDKIDDVAENLLNNKIDVFLCYEHHALELIKNKELQAETVSNAPKEKYVFLMHKTNKDLQSLVNETITDMIKDGSLDEIRTKYMDEDLYSNKLIKESS
jgi:ABC-type amino acid transport substrate-binding protein